MTDSETIKEIHDSRDLSKQWRELSLDERREVLRLEGEVKERIEEARTKQPNLFYGKNRNR